MNDSDCGLLSIGSIQVREIWIGNLPPNITEEHVRQASEMFGEVENVDLHNKVPKSSLFFFFLEDVNIFLLFVCFPTNYGNLVINNLKQNNHFHPILKTKMILITITIAQQRLCLCEI